MATRDRIRELRRVPASSIRKNPKNWRTHPGEQVKALRGILMEHGYCDALLVRELEDGQLELLDGHLRRDTTPDLVVPVLVVDLDDDESDYVLATFDPVGALAQADTDKLTAILDELSPRVDEFRDYVATLYPLETPDVDVPLDLNQSEDAHRKEDDDGNVTIKVMMGPYQFTISESAYHDWVRMAESHVGPDKENIRQFILKRLGIDPCKAASETE